MAAQRPYSQAPLQLSVANEAEGMHANSRACIEKGRRDLPLLFPLFPLAGVQAGQQSSGKTCILTNTKVMEEVGGGVRLCSQVYVTCKLSPWMTQGYLENDVALRITLNKKF